MRYLIIIASVLLLGMTGCDNKKQGGGGKASETAGAAEKATAEAAVDVEKMSVEDLDKEEIPTTEDLEEDAETQITEDNYMEKLDTMEEELEGDKE